MNFKLLLERLYMLTRLCRVSMCESVCREGGVGGTSGRRKCLRIGLNRRENMAHLRQWKKNQGGHTRCVLGDMAGEEVRRRARDKGRTLGSVLSEEPAQSNPCLRKPTLLLWGERTELHLTLPGPQQLKAQGSRSQGSCGCHSNEKVGSASGANSGCCSIKAHPGSATMESNGRCANAGRSESWALARRLLHTEKKTVPSFSPPAGRLTLWFFPHRLGLLGC